MSGFFTGEHRGRAPSRACRPSPRCARQSPAPRGGTTPDEPDIDFNLGVTLSERGELIRRGASIVSRQLNIYSGTKRLDFVFDALPGTDATMDDRSLENARRPSGRSVRAHYRLPRALNLITACCQIFRHSWVAVRCSCGSRDPVASITQ